MFGSVATGSIDCRRCSPEVPQFSLEHWNITLLRSRILQVTLPSTNIAPCGKYLEEINFLLGPSVRCHGKVGGRVVLWVDKIVHHLETMGNHLFAGIYKGIVMLGFFRWCEMDLVPQYDPEPSK